MLVCLTVSPVMAEGNSMAGHQYRLLALLVLISGIIGKFVFIVLLLVCIYKVNLFRQMHGAYERREMSN